MPQNKEYQTSKKVKYSSIDSCSSSWDDLNIEPIVSGGVSPVSCLSSSSESSSKTINSNNTPGGTPRKDKSLRWSNRTKAWRIMDLCTWIGQKGYQSITGLYSDLLRTEKESDLLSEEVVNIKKLLDEVDKKQSRLERENEELREEMVSMWVRMEQLEDKLRSQAQRPQPSGPPGAPPPPPPPPPAWSKVQKKMILPWVTQQILQTARAKLGMARGSVATSTPKQ